MANLIQALYGAVDLMVIGWYCPPESVAAVSTGTQVTQIITSMISGLTLGGTVLVGKYVGRNQPDNVKDTIATNLSVFAIAGILLTFLLLAFVSPILTALKTPEASFFTGKAIRSPPVPAALFLSAAIMPSVPFCVDMEIQKALCFSWLFPAVSI